LVIGRLVALRLGSFPTKVFHPGMAGLAAAINFLIGDPSKWRHVMLWY
jgi:hypothetical protein